MRSAGAIVMLLAAAGASAADDPAEVAELVTALGIEEAATPVRERAAWRPPSKVVLLSPGGLPEADRRELGEAAGGAQIVVAQNVADAAEAAADADAVLGLTSYPGICEPEILDKAKQLRWIISMSAGVERCMAVPTVKRRDLLVTNMRAVNSDEIAEHAIALALALARGLDTFVLNKERARWSRQDAGATGLQFLHGRTLLVVGLGGIGTEVARRGHALGMKVVATRATRRSGPDFVSYVGLPDEMLTLARSADVIVNAAPLTSATAGMFDADFFTALRPTALFINIARGGSVVTDHLVDALHEGSIAGAGLDVVDPEPLPADHPLWRAPNVIITPHISARSEVPNDKRWIIARENLRRYAAGDRMLSVVDLEREY